MISKIIRLPLEKFHEVSEGGILSSFLVDLQTFKVELKYLLEDAQIHFLLHIKMALVAL